MAEQPRFQSRAHAVDGLSNAHGRYIREYPYTREGTKLARDHLRHQIDLAWLPEPLASRLLHNDRAWREFLNDIVKRARGEG